MGSHISVCDATWNSLQHEAAHHAGMQNEISHQLAHLHPTDALEGGDEDNADDDDERRLSAFVGNAVGRGSYRWHCDADPAMLPWDSPWAQFHGIHYNREVCWRALGISLQSQPCPREGGPARALPVQQPTTLSIGRSPSPRWGPTCAMPSL